MSATTIPGRLYEHAQHQGSNSALWYLRDGQWKSITWKGYYERCRSFAASLLHEGYTRGDCVAIIGNNCPEWVIADVGAMFIRCVPTGIYQTSTTEQTGYIAGHCEAKVIVVEDDEHLEKVTSVRAQLPKLKKIVVIKPSTKLNPAEGIVSFEEFCQLGQGREADVESNMRSIVEEDLATLIYTSGTTGPPKGVMLSASNLAKTAEIAINMVSGVRPDDCLVSYLPLSHIAEQLLSIHVPISAGISVWFCDSMDKVKDTLLKARPTLFLGVPRVWEKFRNALEQKFTEATGLKGAIIGWSRTVGMSAGQALLDQGAIGGVLGMKHSIAKKLFFSKLAKQLGLDRLRIAISGAAPIGKDVLEFFLSCGIVVHEVYGLSECTGPATMNMPDPRGTRLGTVGKILPGTEVKIASDGEILIKGPHIFQGYYKNPDATREALVDGWLQTGDIGQFEDGFLRITDRKKDLLITAGGKNVAPQNIEKLLRKIPGVSQAVVIGDRQKYLAALLTLDMEQAPKMAQQRSWPTAPETLVEHPDFLKYIESGIEEANNQLARYESIKKFVVLPRDFTLETGELTPSQKLKRKVVYEKYAKQIESMYSDAS